MKKEKMADIQLQQQGHVCNYCLAHPKHIATVQQIEYLKRDFLIKQNDELKVRMYDKDQYLDDIKLQRFINHGLKKDIEKLKLTIIKLRNKRGK